MPKDFLLGPTSALGEQLAYATCANLLNYPDSAGVEGTRLEPEIAVAMPTVSRDGRTYTFRIRPGIRFSPPSPHRPAALRQSPSAVPETVTAETFRHTIERALSPKLGEGAPAAPFASDIVGVEAYRAGETAHISGIAAHGNTLAIRLVRPSGDFLTRISMPVFCPVPTREPVIPSGLTGAIPSLGPYYMAGLEGNRTVLSRNPNYTGDRPRRAERIVYTNDVPTPEAVALTDAGEIDYLPTDFDPYSPLLPGGRLDGLYGPGSPAAREGRQRYFLPPGPGIAYVAFNTLRPLFRDVTLRRAVSYALDRRALAAAVWQKPTDQIIPAGVPGHPSGHEYPVAAVDVAAARRLAGGQRRSAVLSFCTGTPRALGEIVRANLDRIGMRVSIVPAQGCQDGRNPAAPRGDLVLGFYGTRLRDPAGFLEETLSSGLGGSPLGPGPWNDPGFSRRLEAARSLRDESRSAAYAGLADELVRKMVPFAVYGNWQHSDYFSERVGCRLYQAHYQFVDLGALCLLKG
jgi:ABC-type transport system substrate-binding protein